MERRSAAIWRRSCCVCGAVRANAAGIAWGSRRRPAQTVVVFAAASTTNAIGEIKQQFTQATGVQVQAGFGSSAVLAQQIANGADADVFLSADVSWADYLAKRGLVARRQNLLGNRLVVVLPDDSTLDVKKPAGSVGRGHRAPGPG